MTVKMELTKTLACEACRELHPGPAMSVHIEPSFSLNAAAVVRLKGQKNLHALFWLCPECVRILVP